MLSTGLTFTRLAECCPLGLGARSQVGCLRALKKTNSIGLLNLGKEVKS